MEIILLAINILSFSFGFFAFILIAYLTVLYKKPILKKILLFLSFIFISYFIGIIHYGITMYLDINQFVTKIFTSMQLLLIILVVYSLFEFIYEFAKVKKTLLKKIIRVIIFIPLVFEVIFYAYNIDIRIVSSFFMQLCITLSSLFLLGKGLHIKWSNSDSKIVKMKNDFRVVFLLNIVIFIPFIIYSDLVALKKEELINWEPFFFLIFSITALVFSIRYIVYQSKKSVEVDTISSNINSFKTDYDITEREEEVLLLLLQNQKYREISDNLCISMPTVKTHVSKIYKKTGVTGKADLKHKFSSFKP